VHEFRAPLIVISRAFFALAIGRCHFVKAFSYFAVLPAEENLTQAVTICGKKPTHSDRHREHRWSSEPLRQPPIIRAAIKTPNPSFSSPKDPAIIRSHDHLARWIESMNSTRFWRLIHSWKLQHMPQRPS